MGEMFSLDFLKKAIHMIDWSAALTEYLDEVKENLEENTYATKRSWLGLWMKFLQHR